MRLSRVLCLFSALTATFWSQAGPPPGYYLAWSDEFSGASLNTANWDYRNGSSSAPVSVTNGCAVIALYSDTNGPNGGAEISTEQSFSPTYGYFETSMQSPTTAGAFPAFWLQSPTAGTTNNNPAVNGTEIDIIENAPYTGYADNALHWNGYISGIEKSVANTFSSPAPAAAFHTYGLLWTSNSYTFYVDGAQIWQTSQAVSQRSEYIILSIGINRYLAGTPPSGGYGSLSNTTTKVYFDYVRCYAPIPNVTWDAITSTGGVQDGGGFWDFNNWWNGAGNVSWNDAAPDAATFGAGGTAGNVSLLAPHTATSLTFNPVASGSYNLAGTKTLTINGGITANASASVSAPVVLGTNQTWTVLTNMNLTVSGNIGDGGAGYSLTKSGAGRLTLSGTNTYVGGTTIANGGARWRSQAAVPFQIR